MTFLEPIAAIVAGAIAAPLLTLLYFLKLRRRPVRVSSTMFFEADARDLQVNVPFRMIRPNWLLFLQLLALLLLLLAFARPVLGGATGADDEVVILLDRSASMGATVDGVSRLDEAKGVALDLIDDLARRGAASAQIVVFAHEAEAITPMTSDWRAIRDAIGQVEGVDQPGRLDRAISLVGSLVRADEEAGGGEVVLVTDGNLILQDTRTLPARVRVERVGEPTSNAGIVALGASRHAGEPATWDLFARLVSTDEARREVVLLIDGVESRRRAVTIEGEEVVTFRGVGLEEVTLDLRLEAPPGVLDALEADDRAACVLGPVERPGVLLIRPDQGAILGDTPLESSPLEQVLREMDLGSFRVVGASSFGLLTLEGVDLLVFDRVPGEAPPSIPSLHVGIAPEGMAARAIETEPSYMTWWDRSHPVLRDVPLDTVVCRPTFAVEVGEGVTSIARAGSGPVLVEDEGARRLVVTFSLEDSNWPFHYAFPIFVANAVEHLVGRALDAVSWRTVEATPDGVRAVVGLEDGIAVNLADAFETGLESREIPLVGVEREGGEVERPREIWPWFVMGAGVLLTLEWLLFARRMSP